MITMKSKIRATAAKNIYFLICIWNLTSSVFFLISLNYLRRALLQQTRLALHVLELRSPVQQQLQVFVEHALNFEQLAIDFVKVLVRTRVFVALHQLLYVLVCLAHRI